MTTKRYTIKPQDDLFGVVDNYSPDKVCVINGIRTEIEAEWLCKDMNALNDENEQLKKELQRMYDVATLNKAIEVLENKYDRMLSDGSDEVKDAMRHTVLRCIEDLDELKDDITAR